MDEEKIDYFFAEFDYLISSGVDPSKALLKAAEAYAYVFYKIHNKPKESKFKKFLNLIKEKI
jgi:hypothetical protein